MTSVQNQADRERTLAVADALAVAASAARGAVRASLNAELGRQLGLPYKKLETLDLAHEIAVERWRAVADRVGPALATVGVEV